MDELGGRTIGQRVRYFRERAGMTRAVLGGLMGCSDEGVKTVETGRLQTPRLPLLLRLAEVLSVDDLPKLTREQKLATAVPLPGHPLRLLVPTGWHSTHLSDTMKMCRTSSLRSRPASIGSAAPTSCT